MFFREIYPKSEIEPKLGKFRTVSSTARSLSALEQISGDLENSISKPDDSGDLTDSDEHIMFASENRSERSDEQPVQQFEISQESVNYLGYYSSHEQLMQQMILEKAYTTQRHIKEMVAKGEQKLDLQFLSTVELYFRNGALQDSFVME